jgi:hypothetical protein
LANLDRLPDPAVTMTWLTMQFEPGFERFFNSSMHAWIMYQYATSAQYQDTPGYAELRAMLEATGLEKFTMPQSRWNAGWSVRDPMLARGRVDPSDLETIEVLRIPWEYVIDAQTYEEIKAKFLAIHP